MDELLRGCTDPKDILGEDGLLRQLQKRLIERALAAELTDHLGDEPSARSQEGTYRCNGKAKKVIQTDSAQFQIEVPRDRDASYEPQIVKKWIRPIRDWKAALNQFVILFEDRVPA